MMDKIGGIATGSIDALKGQPILLTLVLLQVIVLVAVIYASIHRQRANTEQFKAVYALLEQCLKRAP
jgi:hypothetical protein